MWLMGNHYINLVAYKTYDFLKKKVRNNEKIMIKIIKKEVKKNKEKLKKIKRS